MHGPPGMEAGAEAATDSAFMNLCVSLYQSGFIHLGLTAEGEAPPHPPDLEAAQGVIEILSMLKRKTQGNLSNEERKILESLLAELQVAWVMKRQGS